MGKWVKKKLGEIGDIITGSTPTTSKLDYWNGDYNFYSPADFTDNIYCDKTERTVTIEGLNVGRCIPENSIMVACIASIGKIAINKTKGITNQQINSIIPFDEFNYLFLYYLLLHKSSVIKNGAAQTTIPIINKEDFSNLEVTIPSSLSEQRRIASILLSADKVIDSTQKLIAKYKSIKQGMMEDLLKPKEGWKKVKLGEVGEILSGGTPSTLNDKYWSGNVLFVTPLDLGRRNEINTTLRTISECGVNNSSANLITANSLAVSTRAPIGLMSIVTQNFTTNQGCKSVKFYEGQNNLFHFYNMTYNVEYIRRFGQGTTFMEISKTDFSNLEFLIPDISEQCRIASILSSIDKKIESEEKVLEKYKNIKKGLMEKLLKGE